MHHVDIRERGDKRRPPIAVYASLAFIDLRVGKLQSARIFSNRRNAKPFGNLHELRVEREARVIERSV